MPVQTYFCMGLQLSDIIEWVLAQTGPGHVDISTFSVGDEFLRRLYMLRRKGAVTSCRIVCDSRAMRKTRLLSASLRSTVDDVRVAQNHSKVVIVYGKEMTAAVITSQNLTRGNRTEAGVVTADPVTIEALRSQFDNLLTRSADVLGTVSATD